MAAIAAAEHAAEEVFVGLAFVHNGADGAAVDFDIGILQHRALLRAAVDTALDGAAVDDDLGRP